MIKKKLFLYMNKFIGKEYLNKFIITADDMIINIIIYQFAQNYSNIELPGHLYTIRKVSMSRGEGGINLKIFGQLIIIIILSSFINILSNIIKIEIIYFMK